MIRQGMIAAGLLAAALGGAAAQTRVPVTAEPLPIAPPSSAPASAQEQWLRNEKAREELNYQRERDRLDLEYRQQRNRQAEEGRGLLGAPVYLPPATPAPAYVAPQYQGGPGTAAPGYGPGIGAPHTAPRGCQQTAPAYDESGRFLANVCIR